MTAFGSSKMATADGSAMGSFNIPFVELLCKTNFSFLEGASTPQEMIGEAKHLGFTQLGITDTNGVYGIARAHKAAKASQIKLIIGAELRLRDTRIFALAKNKNGYGNLCEIITRLHALTDTPSLFQFDILFEKSQDLFFLSHSFSEKLRGVPSFYLIASTFLDYRHSNSLAQTADLARRYHCSVIASNEPLFHEASRKQLSDVLTCIRLGKTLSEAGFSLLPNSSRHLKSPKAMGVLFREFPEWLKNTKNLADECQFSLDEIRYRYPTSLLPPGHTGDSYLRELVLCGARARYGETLSGPVRSQIEHELKLVADLQYADYFLTIWDIIQFAQAQNILFQGRGSAANSILCFVLGITAIDPIRQELLFERFISRERHEPPDIDIDFEHERLEEIISYIYRRYGRHNAAITAEIISFRRRSAIREVGKVFDLSPLAINKFLSHTHRNDAPISPDWNVLYQSLSEYPRSYLEKYTNMMQLVLGFPRHLGTHVGGFVLCDGEDELIRNVPVQNAAMPNRSIIQWDKNDLDDLGFVRVDILGLGILTCLKKALAIVRRAYGHDWKLHSIPPEDPRVYDAICRGDTVGVFQIESRAQMNMLPRLRPRNFFDLVIQIAIIRPGPIQGDMVHPYLRRRHGLERIDYPHPDLEAILKKTLGVPLFQEQIMKIAMQVAGFSPGEADALRRAMGTWRKDGSLSQMGERFRVGLSRKGIAPHFCERIFKQIEGFAEYGFPESHAASFAILAYATAYLKTHYPDVYLTAILNSQPMGFYQSQTLIHDAKRHNVKIWGIDINQSQWDNFLESPGNVRLGFREIRGISRMVILRLTQIREEKPFASLDDLVSRMKEHGINRRDLILLASANAFDCFQVKRRQILWEIASLPIPDSLYMPTPDDVLLPSERPWETIVLDYESSGVSLFSHPLAYLRSDLVEQGAASSSGLRFLRNKQRVKVAGLVICRQMPATSSGVLFITLEDEFGFINLVIWNNIYRKFRECLVTQSFLFCEGTIQKGQKEEQKADKVTHIIVESVRPVTIDSPKLPSHDFC